MAKKNIEITKDGYLDLINTVLNLKEEERNICLDRYRRADQLMEAENGFILAGRNAVSFLMLAESKLVSAAVAVLLEYTPFGLLKVKRPLPPVTLLPAVILPVCKTQSVCVAP